LEGYTDTNPLPNWPSLINTALGEFSRISEYKRENGTLTTVANQIAYTLPALAATDNDWVRLPDVWYNSSGTVGGGGQWLMLTDRNRLKTFDPNWKLVGAGTPRFYYHITPNSIGLYPPPSAGSISIYIEGVREATKLSAETDSPDFPEFYHKAIPRIAVWYHAEKYGRGEALAVARGWYEEGIKLAHDLRRELFAGEAPAFQIRQQQEFRQRQTLGGWQRSGLR